VLVSILAIAAAVVAFDDSTVVFTVFTGNGEAFERDRQLFSKSVHHLVLQRQFVTSSAVMAGAGSGLAGSAPV
jgi:hypothetical protein